MTTITIPREVLERLYRDMGRIADWQGSYGPYPEANSDEWGAMVITTARQAVRDLETAVTSALAAAPADAGEWVRVPKVPTRAMARAATLKYPGVSVRPVAIWQTMIAAAPPAPADAPPVFAQLLADRSMADHRAERYRGLCMWAAGQLLDAGSADASQTVNDKVHEVDCMPYTPGPLPADAPQPTVWIQPDHLQQAKRAPFHCHVAPFKRHPDFVPLYLAAPQPNQSPADAPQPVAYMYHDARSAAEANPMIHSTLCVHASQRQPHCRNETPLYEHPPVAQPTQESEAREGEAEFDTNPATQWCGYCGRGGNQK